MICAQTGPTKKKMVRIFGRQQHTEHRHRANDRKLLCWSGMKGEEKRRKSSGSDIDSN